MPGLWMDIDERRLIMINFVGRVEEIQMFHQSIEALLKKRSPIHQVFLITGEGGFGKTTLLRKYEEILQTEYSHRLLCIYLDCEQIGLRPQDGTPPLMRKLVDLLKIADPEFQACQFEQAWCIFEQTWHKRDEHRHQVELSRALVEDLVSLSSHKPLVILLDTWECVASFASEWLRQGLLRHSIKSEGRIVFVIAGRLSEEFILKTRDALHEVGALIHDRNLGKFTESEVKEFLKIEGIKENDVNKVYRLTRGIPLALAIFKEIALRFRESAGVVEEPESVDTDKKIITMMVIRFFRHLDRHSDLINRLYRQIFYTLAMLGTIRCGDSVRAQLLEKWWEQIPPKGPKFLQLSDKLPKEFSFIQSNLNLHPDVMEIIVDYLKREKRHEAVILAKQAIEVCKSMLTPGGVESDKNCWNLHLINFLFWAQGYRQGISSALELVASGSARLRDDLYELLCKWEEDIAEHGFKDHISYLINVIKNWGSREASSLFQKLTAIFQTKREEQIAGLLSQARRAAQRGNYGDAVHAIEQAANLIGGTPPIPSEQWAWVINSTVQNCLQDKHAWLDALKIVQKGRRLVDDDPWLLLAEAEVLIRLKMFPQAYARLQNVRSSLSRANQRFLMVMEDIEQNINRQIQKIPTKGRKSARIMTNMGDLSSAYGDFERAERYYQEALERDPFYIPAAIKLAHLLRQIGQINQAAQWLEDIEQTINTLETQRIVTPDILTQWKARFEECKGSIYVTQWVLENQSQDLDQSIFHFKRAIELSPGYANPYIGIAWVYLYRNDGEKAYDYLKEARELLEQEEKGPLYQVYNGMGIAKLLCHNQGERFFGIARTLCEQTRKDKITRPYQVRAHHGIASLGLRDFDQASTNFSQLAEFRTAKGWWNTLKKDVELLCDLLPPDTQQQVGEILGILF
jgi:tetratricopeptide (TPR) repeat protein